MKYHNVKLGVALKNFSWLELYWNNVPAESPEMAIKFCGIAARELIGENYVAYWNIRTEQLFPLSPLS